MLTDISLRNNITFIMVTHDMDLAKIAQRIITLKDGEIVSDYRQP